MKGRACIKKQNATRNAFLDQENRQRPALLQLFFLFRHRTVARLKAVITRLDLVMVVPEPIYTCDRMNGRSKS